MNRVFRTVVVFTLTVVPALAQQEPADEIITKTYNISDLTRAMSSYPLPGGTSGGGQTLYAGGAVPASGEMASAITGEDLIRLIQETVAADSWKENGGTIGAIRELGGVLVVGQTVTNHDAIRQLLTQLRESPGPSSIMSVRAFWLRLTPAEVAAIFAGTKRDPQAPATDMPAVPEALLDKAHLFYMGQTMCFSSQTTYIRSGRSKEYVADLQPVVGTNAVGYDPTMATATNGVDLQVRPEIAPGGEATVLDLRSRVQQVSMDDAPFTVRPATQPTDLPPGAFGVERPTVVSQEFQTTVRIPLRRRVLIGGMTLEPAEMGAEPTQLYLAVEVDAVR